MKMYRRSLALLTDLYELTMAYGYWKLGITGKHATFCLYFREHPFHGGFSVACGLGAVIEYLREIHFDDDDLAYLATLTGGDGQPLFESGFLDYLRALEFALDVDAIPEGTVVFPREPLVRVRGPILPAQILESALLNLINFQTLIATKAARVCLAARGDAVIEFGLRRAQGVDGGVSASRAAYVGGCDAVSNTLAGRLFDIPVKGTHAHSWVMAFDSELESFHGYARALPNNCIFLVDTYHTLDGVRHAVEVGKSLRAQGHQLAGIRLDSGDLAYLSIEARKILDAAGFPDAVIVASNELDEYLIESLKEQGAAINVWGVGTKLATAYDQPALGGVYKLTSLRPPDGVWEPKIKLSEQVIKINIPGQLQVRRYRGEDGFIGDMIYEETLGIQQPVIIDPTDPSRHKALPADVPTEDLLVPIFRNGRQVYDIPPLADSRARTQQQLAHLHPSIKRFIHPHEYPVGLEPALADLRNRLIVEARGG